MIKDNDTRERVTTVLVLLATLVTWLSLTSGAFIDNIKMVRREPGVQMFVNNDHVGYATNCGERWFHFGKLVTRTKERKEQINKYYVRLETTVM